MHARNVIGKLLIRASRRMSGHLRKTKSCSKSLDASEENGARLAKKCNAVDLDVETGNAKVTTAAECISNLSHRWRLLERKKAAALRAVGQAPTPGNAFNTTSKSSSNSPSATNANNGILTPPEPGQPSPSSRENQPTLSPAQLPPPPPPPEETQSPESQATDLGPSHSEPMFDLWPPYYPPESYPIPGSSLISSHSFRLPSPEIVSVSPHIAPFQFSSSSLSAALSAPPQPSRPLPPVANEPPLMEVQPEPEAPSLTDGSGNADQNDDNNDNFMSLDDPPVSATAETAPTIEHFTTALLPRVFTSSPTLQPPAPLNVQHSSIPISPISHPNDIPLQADQIADFWKSPNPLTDLLAPLFEQSPQSTTDNNLLVDTNYEDLSSASSTPFLFASSLSPTSSPNVLSPVDLPSSEQSTSSTGSLLFSMPREPTRPYIPPPRRSRPTSTKKLLKPGTPMRLSSSLPLTAEYV